MNFKKAILNARMVDALIIDEGMVLRRLNNDIEIKYELTENDETIQFKSCHIARVGDHIVRSESGAAVLVPKAEYAARFTEIDPRLFLYVSDEKDYVTINYTNPPGVTGELRMLATAKKLRHDDWHISDAEDIIGLDVAEMRLRMVAFDLLLRAVKDLENEE
jgi:hypothetical protein